MTSPGKRPPLREELSLFQATIAAEGFTTGAGAATGDSFIDAGLIGVGANSFFSMLAVVYPGQPRLVDSMDVTAFNNATGEVTLSRAYKGVAAAIPVGVRYKILTFRFVPAEVAALTALVNNVITSQGRQLFELDKWSEGLLQVQLGDGVAGATVALPDIDLTSLPVGAIVVEAYVMFKFWNIENTFAGVNKLNGATGALASQVIQLRSDAPLAYVDAINFPDDYFTFAAAGVGNGDVIIGSLNVAGATGVDENDIYNLRWLLGRADQDFLEFNNVQVGLKIRYSV